MLCLPLTWSSQTQVTSLGLRCEHQSNSAITLALEDFKTLCILQGSSKLLRGKQFATAHVLELVGSSDMLYLPDLVQYGLPSSHTIQDLQQGPGELASFSCQAAFSITLEGGTDYGVSMVCLVSSTTFS